MPKLKPTLVMLSPPILALLSNILVTIFLPPSTLIQFILPSVVLYIVFGLMIYAVLQARGWKFKDLEFKKEKLLRNIGIGTLGGLVTITIAFLIWGFAFGAVESFKLQGFLRYLMIGFVGNLTEPWHWHWGLVRGFLFTFIMALILAKLYLRQKSIATPVMAHLTNNIIGYSHLIVFSSL